MAVRPFSAVARDKTEIYVALKNLLVDVSKFLSTYFYLDMSSFYKKNLVLDFVYKIEAFIGVFCKGRSGHADYKW